MKIPVSVIIRVLNERNNIEECIEYCKANNPLEIIIVDGGSTDGTLELLSKISGVRVLKSKKGLAIQRDVGIFNSSKESKYIAIVDADDRLDKLCLENLFNDLEKSGCDAAQAEHECLGILLNKKTNYWENAMLINMKIIRDLNKKSNEIIMVGRPALYRKEALLKVLDEESYSYTTAAEDSDLAYKLKKEGFNFIVGSGLTYRKHIDSFNKLFKRWLSYGSGDAKFIKLHPERKYRVLRHLLFEYPIRRSYYCIKDYSYKYAVFFVLQGLIRFFGLVKYFTLGIGKVDSYK